MAWPDYTEYFNSAWGWPDEYSGSFATLLAAANIQLDSNPPYSVTDFFSIYPNFAGNSTQATCNTDGSTNVLTNVSTFVGVALSQLISGPGIPTGSVITGFNATSKTITISNNTTTAATGVGITIYVTTLVLLAVINAFVYMATSSLVQARWGPLWYMAMAMYIAHFATLWLEAQASTPNSNAAQVATAGLALGIKISKAAGDVSLGIKPLDGLEDWGSFQLTTYGQQLATFAKTVGSGSMLIY
jgi:hypothetical protein